MTEILFVLLAGLLVTGGVAHLIVKAQDVADGARRWFKVAAWLAPGAILLLAWQFNVSLPWPVILAAAGVVAGVVWFRWSRSGSVITRLGQRHVQKKGVASTVDILRVGSALAMRRTLRVIRPSMAGLTRWQRARVKTTEVAVPLARVGRIKLYSSLRDVVAIFGGPGTGKTGKLAGLIIDFPGAVVSTSTRVDLMDLTRPLREAGGRPVYVFNPGGLGDIPSSITFDPLTGCKDPVTATLRAADMIPESEGPGDHSYWEGQARRVLAALLHAAALGDMRMQDVLMWVSDPVGSAPLVTRLLRRSPEPAFAVNYKQYHSTNDKTLTSITSSIMPALSWLTSPSAVAATASGKRFDVAALLHDRGTVYLLGRHEAHTAPLLAALTGHIAHEARKLAAGRRLDPPLGLFLDEAARVTPVPLPDWTGDFGGSGVHICMAFQSRADVEARWGEAGAARVINNVGGLMILGGTKDAKDLAAWAALIGERDERVVTHGANGRVTSRTTRKVPVLTGAQLANLPRGRAVVIRNGMPPAVGRVQMAWRRPDVARPLWWRALTGARSYIARRVVSPALPVPARVSPAPSVAQSPAVAPAREVAGVGR